MELPPVDEGLSCTRCDEVYIVNACNRMIDYLLYRAPGFDFRNVAVINGAKQGAFRGVGLVEIDIEDS